MIAELEGRLHALRQQLSRHDLDAILIQTRMSSLYLSGFSSSNSLILVTRNKAYFLTDFRYIVKASETIKHMEVRQIPQNVLSEMADLVRKHKVKRLGFEEAISYAEYYALKTTILNAELVPSGYLISNLRKIKSPSEIKTIAGNQRLNEKLFLSAVNAVRSGVTEIQIRNGILTEMIANQCEEAFGSIIAAGANSALPHAVPSLAKVKNNSFLLFDMGVKKNLYYSDMTRTVAVGEKLPNKAKEIYSVVLEAQLSALAAVRPGVSCKDVDAVARNIISAAGFGEYYGHGLGHGVGLEIHEGPSLNPRSNDVLKAGMVITVEPGIYIPGFGGVRIEDLIVVTETGYRNLTNVPKDLRTISL